MILSEAPSYIRNNYDLVIKLKNVSIESNYIFISL